MEPAPPNQPITKEILKAKVGLSFYFGPHGTDNDARALRPHIEKCDIFIPELAGWSKSMKQTYNDVSFGRSTAADASKRIGGNFPYYKMGLFEEIGGTNKPVTFIDVPQDHPLLAEEDQLGLHKADHIGNIQFADAKAKRLEFARKEADLTSRREKYMAEQLPEALAQVLRENPDLALKNKLNVLISLGSTHTQVAHLLRSEGYRVEGRNFPEESYSFGGYSREMARRAIFNKPIPDELSARTVIEDLFVAYYGKSLGFLVDNALDIYSLGRVLISRLSPEELKQCWDGMRKDVGAGFQKEFEAALKAKGAVLPNTSTQLHMLIGSAKRAVPQKS